MAMDRTTKRFGMRRLHLVAFVALLLGALWLSAGAAAQGSLWSVPFLVFAVYSGWQIYRFKSFRFEVGEEEVVHHVPSRRVGPSVLSSFRWDEVVRVKGTMALETAGQVWLWGDAVTVELTSRYVTLYPEAFGDEALRVFLGAADQRGLLDG
jgi:hypothetical protein